MIDLQILDPSTLWAMKLDSLTTLTRSLEGKTLDEIAAAPRRTAADEALALRAALGQMDDLEGAFTAGRVGSTAVIPIMGTIRPRPSFSIFEMLFGGNSTNLLTLQHDLDVAMSSHLIEDVVFFIDSPGGLTSGVSDAADMIYEQRGTKPMTAFVADTGASAAYWLASAAEEIVMSRTAEVGSIGVQAMATDISKLQERMGVKEITIISSQSPAKNLDLNSDKGRALIQRRVDDQAAVFIEKVARNRGVSQEEALERFGQGDVLIAERAVAVGLADRIGTFEALLQTSTQGGLQMAAKQGETTLESTPITKELIEREHPLIAAAFRAEGHKPGVEEGEKNAYARIQAIEAMQIEGTEKYIAEVKFDSKQTPAMVAVEILKRVRENKLDPSALINKDSPDPLKHEGMPVDEKAAKIKTAAASPVLSSDPKVFEEQMAAGFKALKEASKR